MSGLYTKNALTIYKKLYFTEGETKPEQVHKRVADFIGNTEEEKTHFKLMMDEKAFRPNTPVLINAGTNGKNPWDNQLNACFTVGLEDSMESIIEMWSVCAKIFASGAGAGIPITNLREQGSSIAGNKGEASGALTYLHVVQSVADTVRSGGRHRRAALLGSAKYNHPQIMEIIKSKQNNSLSAFNISILVDDSFMQAEEKELINLVSPNKNSIVGSIEKKELWNTLIDCAWNTGDPGLLFYDTINRYNPIPSYGDIVTTNPCGEIPLPNWSVCCLGSINLNNILEFTKNKIYEISWRKFKSYIKWSVRFLDNVIDKTTYLHPKFEETMKKTRPIGLGIMGFADLLYKLHIGYNTQEARNLFEKICNTLTTTAIEESIELASEKGKITVPKRDVEHFEEIIEYYLNDPTSFAVEDEYRENGIRNSTWTSIAPTGSISISADCSYSFEPCFALAFDKQIAETNEILTFINPIFEPELNKWINSRNTYKFSKEKVLQDIKDNKGSIQSLKYLPEEMREVFVTAHDISPIEKLEMQAAGQRNISLGISSTCNLPNSATREDIDLIYHKAWSLGLKGITVYRDGCKDNQPIHFGEKECKEAVVELKTIVVDKPILMTRPVIREGTTCEIDTPHGRLFITGNKNEDGKIFETFLRIGKQGSLNNLLIDALSRCISKALQSGLNLDVFAETLRGNKEIPFRFRLKPNQEEPFYAESLVDAIGIIFKELYLKEPVRNETGEIFRLCPNCGKYSLDPSGCSRGGYCIICNYSNCS